MLISNGMFYFNHMFNNKNYSSAKIKNSTYSDAINEYYKTYGADEGEHLRKRKNRKARCDG